MMPFTRMIVESTSAAIPAITKPVDEPESCVPSGRGWRGDSCGIEDQRDDYRPEHYDPVVAGFVDDFLAGDQIISR